MERASESERLAARRGVGGEAVAPARGVAAEAAAEGAGGRGVARDFLCRIA